jgi:hypothetical protein
LLDIGHSQRASVLIMYLWAAAFSGIVVWLSIEKTELPKAANHHGSPVIVFVLITLAAVVILLLLSMPWRRWVDRSRDGAVAARPPATDWAVSGAPARSDAELVSTAAPTRSAQGMGSRPPADGPRTAGEQGAGGDGAPRGPAHHAAPRQPGDDAPNGYRPAHGARRRGDRSVDDDARRRGDRSADNGAAWWSDSGASAETVSGEAGNSPPPDDARRPVSQDEALGGTGRPRYPRGGGDLAGGSRPTEFLPGDSGGLAAGTMPPAVDESDWGWFRPTAGSVPESGRSRES